MVREISCHDNILQLHLHKDEDPRVAETAVVGYGHEDYGEGNLSVIILVLLDVLKRFMETDTIVIQVLITLASYGRTGEQ